MDKEKIIKTGIVTHISNKQDFRGVKLDEDPRWIGSKFYKGIVPNVGDEVEVEAQVSGDFLNLMKVTILKANPKIESKTYSSSSAEMLTAYAKDLAVAYLNSDRDNTQSIKIPLKELMVLSAEAVLLAYNILKGEKPSEYTDEDGAL